jgi:hypothetical protein
LPASGSVWTVKFVDGNNEQELTYENNKIILMNEKTDKALCYSNDDHKRK